MTQPARAAIKLDFPVEHDGRRYDVFSLRRPVVGDLLAAEAEAKGNDKVEEVVLLARLAGCPREAIEALDFADYFKLQRQLIDWRRGFRPPSEAEASDGASSSSAASPAGAASTLN